MHLTVTDSEGRTATALNDDYVVKVKDDCSDPVATIDTPSSDITVLIGTTVPFAGSATGGDPPYAYAWRFVRAGNDAASEGENANFQFLEEGLWFVSFAVKDAANDQGFDRREVNVVGTTFGVRIDSPSPGESFSKDTDVHFASTVKGGSLALLSGGPMATMPTTYLWSFGAGSGILDSNEEFPTVQYATPGAYTVSLTVSNGTDEASDSVDIGIIDATSINAPISVTKEIALTPSNFGGSSTPKGGAMFLGMGGAAILDSPSFSFGPVILSGTTFDGGAVAAPVSGPETIAFFNATGSHISYHLGGGIFGAPAELSTDTVRHIAMVDGDPTSDTFVVVAREGIQQYNFNSGTQMFELGDEFLPTSFAGIVGSLASATVRPGGSMLAVSTSSPGQLWHHDGVVGNAATLLGTLGDKAWRIARLGDLCVVNNINSSTVSVITWSGGSSATIHGTFPTGTDPRSVDLMVLGNGNIGCVVAAHDFDIEDNLVTVAEITPAGSIVSSNTFNAPSICVFPNSAVWARDGTTQIVVHCSSSSNVVLLDSGL